MPSQPDCARLDQDVGDDSFEEELARWMVLEMLRACVRVQPKAQA